MAGSGTGMGMGMDMDMFIGGFGKGLPAVGMAPVMPGTTGCMPGCICGWGKGRCPGLPGTYWGSACATDARLRLRLRVGRGHGGAKVKRPKRGRHGADIHTHVVVLALVRHLRRHLPREHPAAPAAVHGPPILVQVLLVDVLLVVLAPLAARREAALRVREAPVLRVCARAAAVGAARVVAHESLAVVEGSGVV